MLVLPILPSANLTRASTQRYYCVAFSCPNQSTHKGGYQWIFGLLEEEAKLIPDFDSCGLLPQGMFRASWREIEKRFLNVIAGETDY